MSTGAYLDNNTCIHTSSFYFSISEAKRQTNILGIGRACLGIVKTAGGYHWQYYNLDKVESEEK